MSTIINFKPRPTSPEAYQRLFGALETASRHIPCTYSCSKKISALQALRHVRTEYSWPKDVCYELNRCIDAIDLLDREAAILQVDRSRDSLRKFVTNKALLP